jgi:hypothetical protein
MKKLIKQTDNYSIYESEFMGFTQTFRQWRNDHIEIQFNDNFAKANGFKSVEDMLISNKGMKETLLVGFGSIPQWITITSDGQFLVKNTQNNYLYN